MNLRSVATPPDPIALHSLNLLYKSVFTLGKFFRRLQQGDVTRFVDLPLCDDLILYYWEKVVQANSSAELIEGMLVGTQRGQGRSISLRLPDCRIPRSHSRGWDGSIQGESCSMGPSEESKDRTYFERVFHSSIVQSRLTIFQHFPGILWRPLLHFSFLVSCRLTQTTLMAGWRPPRSGSTLRTRAMNCGSLRFG
jgi:hypothetical protein